MDNNQMDKFLRFEKKWITFLKKKMDKKKTYAPPKVIFNQKGTGNAPAIKYLGQVNRLVRG